ncbi:MAG: HU family DNA-binding protein [Acidobacteria bacterium]|nr:HU family DNA-binding protein [Acidobacteriota bacterium]
MNKGDLVARISADAKITRSQAGAALDSFIDNVTKTLKGGKKVTIVGFGTFGTSKRKARTGRNPQTGKPIKIAAKRVARFTAGKQLKNAVNR